MPILVIYFEKKRNSWETLVNNCNCFIGIWGSIWDQIAHAVTSQILIFTSKILGAILRTEAISEVWGS